MGLSSEVKRVMGGLWRNREGKLFGEKHYVLLGDVGEQRGQTNKIPGHKEGLFVSLFLIAWNTVARILNCSALGM